MTIGTGKEIEVLLASRAYESHPVEGGFVFLRDLARGVARVTGIRPSFLSTRPEGEQDGVNLTGNLAETGWGLRARLGFARATWSRHGDFDVVHTAHVPTGLNVAYFRRLRSVGVRSGTKYLQTITALPRDSSFPLENLCWGDHIVCQSSRLYERLEKDQSKPVSLIPPWPDPGRVEFDGRRREETRGDRFAPFRNVVVFPGEFARLGIDGSFGACLTPLLEGRSETCIALACRDDADRVGNRVKNSLRSDVADRVFIVGKITWILRLLEASDLIIYPARSMAGKFQPPLVLLEALTLGVPVLVSPEVHLPSINDDECMVFVEPTVPWERFGRRAARLIDEGRSSRRGVGGYAEMVASYRECYARLNNESANTSTANDRGLAPPADDIFIV